MAAIFPNIGTLLTIKFLVYSLISNIKEIKGEYRSVTHGKSSTRIAKSDLMKVIGNYEDLLAHLRAISSQTIGIDGINGSGKTYLATQLSEDLGYPLFNVDKYLIKDQRGYVNFVKYESLKTELNNSPSFVIDAVCLSEVLNNLNTSVNTTIYVKRCSEYGLWYEEAEYDNQCNYFEPSNFDITQSPLTKEIIKYHHSYRPFDKSDLIYTRVKIIAPVS